MIKKIKASELELIGGWIFDGKTIIADETAKRIDWLINTELEKIGSNDWDILYKDLSDGRFWELTYPSSNLHGGGPPTLTFLSSESAREKYQLK